MLHYPESIKNRYRKDIDMEAKRKSPNTQAGRTGDKCSGKDTKRTRIERFELVSKWKVPVEVLILERGKG